MGAGKGQRHDARRQHQRDGDRESPQPPLARFDLPYRSRAASIVFFFMQSGPTQYRLRVTSVITMEGK